MGDKVEFKFHLPKVINFIRLIPLETRGIEMVSILGLIGMIVIISMGGSTDRSDPIYREMLSASDPVIWVIGLTILATVHLTSIMTTIKSNTSLGRMVCSLIEMFVMIYVTTMGFLLDLDILIVFAIGNTIGTIWVVIRHGLVK